MKIIEMTDSYYPIIDGVMIGVNNCTKILNAKEGVTCEVVTVGNEEADDKIFPYPVLRSIYLRHPFNKTYVWPLPMIDFKLQKQLKNTEINLIHAHTPFMIGHFGMRLARKKKIPIVATFHTKFYDDFMEATHSKIISKILLKYIVKFFEKCDLVITVNEHAKKTLQDYGYRGEAAIVPNGVDLILPKNPEREIKKIKDEYNVKTGEELFLFIGAHNFKKNIKLIYESLALYKENNPNFKLIMVGTGNNVKEIKALGKSLGLNKNLIYTGKIKDRNKLTNICLAADLFIFPSLYDTVSLVVREAAFCSTPSVVVENTGPSENITHGVNGFLCKNNADSLCAEITAALKDKKKLKQIGKKAAETLPVTWDAVVDQLLTLYQETLAKK